MGYEYFYQIIAEWLLLSMLICIDFPLQILIMDIFFKIFLSMLPLLPTTVASGHKDAAPAWCETLSREKFARLFPQDHARL